MSVINTIAARITELESTMNSIKASVETDGRLLTQDEETKMEAAQSEHAALTKQAKLLNGVTGAVKAASEPARRPVITSNEKSFKTFGHFLNAVKEAKNNSSIEQRLRNAASEYGSEGVNADGGYALPPDVRGDIQSFLYGQNSLLGLTDQVPTFSNYLSFPIDTDEAWSGQMSGSWLTEAGVYNEAKPALGTLNVSVGKIGTIVNISEELAQDVAAMGAFVTRKAGERLNYLVNTAILSGSGANNGPNGILLGTAKKVVAKESGQASGTVVNQNLLKMYYGMVQADRANGVWLVSDSAEYALATTSFSGSTLMSKAGDVTNPLGNTIFGRPVIVVPQLAALGAEGDILFVNLKKYLAVVKGGVNTQATPFYYWNQDINSFKVSLRLGGKCWEAAAKTLPDSTTRSPYVVLGAR